MLSSLKGAGTRSRTGTLTDADSPRRRPQLPECPYSLIIQIFDFLPIFQRTWVLPQLSKTCYQRVFKIPVSPASSVFSISSGGSSSGSSTFSSPSQSRSTSLTHPLPSSTKGDNPSKFGLILLPFFIYSNIFDFIGFIGIYKEGFFTYSKKFRALLKFYIKTRTEFCFWNEKEENVLRGMSQMPRLCFLRLSGICCQVTSGLVNALLATPTLCPLLQEIDSLRVPNITVAEMSSLYSQRPMLTLCIQEMAVKPDIMELSDLLKSEEGYERFVKFLRAKVEPDGAFFWRKVLEYQQLTSDLEDAASRIWRQYLEEGAPFEVEVGNATWLTTKHWVELIRVGRYHQGLKDQPDLKKLTPASQTTRIFGDLGDLSEISPLTSSRSGNSTTRSPQFTHLRSLLVSANARDDSRETYSPHFHNLSILRYNDPYCRGGEETGKLIKRTEQAHDSAGRRLAFDKCENLDNHDPSAGRRLTFEKCENLDTQTSLKIPENQSPTFSTPRKFSRFLKIPIVGETVPLPAPDPYRVRLKPSPSTEKLLDVDGTMVALKNSSDSCEFQSGSSTVQNTPSIHACRDEDEADDCKVKGPETDIKKRGVFFNHRRSISLKDPTSIPTFPGPELEEIPPLLHIFDLAQDEVYINMVVQDYPRFLVWEQSKRDSGDGNMANLILRGEVNPGRYSISQEGAIQHETIDPPCWKSCCIIS